MVETRDVRAGRPRRSLRPLAEAGAGATALVLLFSPVADALVDSLPAQASRRSVRELNYDVTPRRDRKSVV